MFCKGLNINLYFWIRKDYVNLVVVDGWDDVVSKGRKNEKRKFMKS